MKLLVLLAVTALLAPRAWASSPAPIIIAHRGASGYLPEHTIAAKAYAHALGSHYIEQDLVLSKDGVPVVLHDIEIDTVTDVAVRFPGRARANGHFYAIDFTVAELKQLRVTERFNPQTGERIFAGRFPAWKSSFAVSTFEEELELIQGLNHSTGRVAGIYPEFKSPGWHRRQGQDLSAIALKILARHGYTGKDAPCFVQCFEFEEVKRIREELGWEGRLVQLIGRYGAGEVDAAGKGEPRDNTPLMRSDALAEVARYADGIGPSLVHLLAPGDGAPKPGDLVRRAHRLRLLVHPYTFRADALPRQFATADECLDFVFRQAGADGLFADQPDVALRYLQAGAAPRRP